MDEATRSIDFPAHDGPVLRMGVRIVSTLPANIYPGPPRMVNSATDAPFSGHRVTHLEGTSGSLSWFRNLLILPPLIA